MFANKDGCFEKQKLEISENGKRAILEYEARRAERINLVIAIEAILLSILNLLIATTKG